MWRPLSCALGPNTNPPCLQIRRPNNYDITLALMLGPTDPNPAMEVRPVGGGDAAPGAPGCGGRRAAWSLPRRRNGSARSVGRSAQVLRGGRAAAA